MHGMKGMVFAAAFVAACCGSAEPSAAGDGAEYCRTVVEPALAGVFASWTVRLPDAESLAAACTNVDWRVVRKRRSRQHMVWIGGIEPAGRATWRLGVIRDRGGAFALDARMWPFAADPSAVTNSLATNAHVRVVSRAADPAAAAAPIAEAKRLVAQARELRLQGKFPAASKMLRAAGTRDPLDAWNLVERTFLEDGGEGAVAAAREGRAYPEVSVSQCRTSYLEIGASNEVRLIDRQIKQTGEK